jgi:hypothetical protein
MTTIEQQQVNVQDLQRLNEAINTTMQCLQRVVPQLAMLQWQQTQLPFGPSHIGMQPIGFGQQLGFGTQPWMDPVTQAYVQGHTQALRSILSQQGGTQGYGFAQQPYGLGHQLAFGIPQSPYAQFGQRSF